MHRPAGPTAPETPLTRRWFSGLRGAFAHTPRTIGLVWRSSARLTVLVQALTLVLAVLPLGIAYVGKIITDAVVAHDGRATLRWVVVELLLVALQVVGARVVAVASDTLGARLGIDINVRILEKALTLQLSHFEDAEFYDQLTRARREASFRPLSVVTALFRMGQSFVTLAGYVIILTRFSGLAVAGLVVAALPAAIVEVRYSNKTFRLKNWRAPETRQINYLEYVLANDEHAKEVKLFGLGPMLLGRYKALSEKMYVEDWALAGKHAAWGSLVSLGATGAFYASYAAMAVAAAAGSFSLGTMVLYVMAFRQGQQALQAILGGMGSMYESNLYMSNLFSFLDLDPLAPRVDGEAASEDCESPAPAARPGRSAEGIVFDRVGFRYAGSKTWALRDVSLAIPPGKSLALVGQNGAGKTTFIKLLARLYEPTEGRILLDGKDLRDWDPEALRARIGVVFQDFNQYQLLVEENVGLGSVNHLDDGARVDRAIASGGARDAVDALPKGKKTHLGKWFKEGVELSGGQWQKIALSRAFMREEADILVLDEPTAALDAEAEHAVFQRFKELTAGRTSILISHRFPTVRMADRIVVLEGGRVLEEGTHAALVERAGRYAHLFELQAHGYQ